MVDRSIMDWGLSQGMIFLLTGVVIVLVRIIFVSAPTHQFLVNSAYPKSNPNKPTLPPASKAHVPAVPYPYSIPL